MHFWGPALAAILCPKIAPVALQLCPIYQSPVPLLLFFSHYQNFRNGWPDSSQQDWKPFPEYNLGTFVPLFRNM
jgi:hypothetical protein